MRIKKNLQILFFTVLFGLIHFYVLSAQAVEGPYNYYLPYLSTVGGDWTGLALANGSKTSRAPVTVKVYGENGSLMMDFAKNLAVDGQTAFSVTPASASRGWILVNSHQPLTGLAFLGNGNPALMADIPFVSEPATELVVPHIAQ
ncbi:hypothetical protein KAI46_12490, partial [bacterium]|nr:hypothetical protein [bacterium]